MAKALDGFIVRAADEGVHGAEEVGDLVGFAGGKEGGKHAWVVEAEVEVFIFGAFDDEELSEMLAEFAEGGGGFGEDAPGFVADGFEEPRGERVVGFEADQIGGDLRDIIIEIAGVEAAVVGGVLLQHGEEVVAGGAVKDRVGGERGVAVLGEENIPERAGLLSGGGRHAGVGFVREKI